MIFSSASQALALGAYSVGVAALQLAPAVASSRVLTLTSSVVIGLIACLLAAARSRRLAGDHSVLSLHPRRNPLIWQGVLWIAVVIAVGFWLESRMWPQSESLLRTGIYLLVVFAWCEAIAHFLEYFRR